ncbi:MAG: A24 family peptidase [Candidatus Dormibacteraeota bacterium]|nr:A24 family peptidase [Candidatus Dormibacteraeota bacterium]
MSVGAALGWGILGGAAGYLVGMLCLLLEGHIGEMEDGEAAGRTRLETLLLPALGALGFFMFASRDGWTGGLLIHSLWIVVLIQILGFDLKHRLILDVVTLPSMVVALALASFSPDLNLFQALFGMAVGGLALLPFALASSLFHQGAGFGWGDVKLGMVIGSITGMSLNYGGLYTLWALIAGTLIGGVITILLLVTRRLGLRDAVPYGPFLVVGCGIILFFM